MVFLLMVQASFPCPLCSVLHQHLLFLSRPSYPPLFTFPSVPPLNPVNAVEGGRFWLHQQILVHRAQILSGMRKPEGVGTVAGKRFY